MNLLEPPHSAYFSAFCRSTWTSPAAGEAAAPAHRIIHARGVRLPVPVRLERLGLRAGRGYFKCGSDPWPSDFATDVRVLAGDGLAWKPIVGAERACAGRRRKDDTSWFDLGPVEAAAALVRAAPQRGGRLVAELEPRHVGRVARGLVGRRRPGGPVRHRAACASTAAASGGCPGASRRRSTAARSATGHGSSRSVSGCARPRSPSSPSTTRGGDGWTATFSPSRASTTSCTRCASTSCRASGSPRSRDPRRSRSTPTASRAPAALPVPWSSTTCSSPRRASDTGCAGKSARTACGSPPSARVTDRCVRGRAARGTSASTRACPRSSTIGAHRPRRGDGHARPPRAPARAGLRHARRDGRRRRGGARCGPLAIRFSPTVRMPLPRQQPCSPSSMSPRELSLQTVS